jgi:uncharacterized protein
MHTTPKVNRARLVTGLFLSLVLFGSGCAHRPAAAPSGDAMHLGKQAYQAQRYQAAFEIFSTLAEQGNVDAQYTLGYMLYYGQGVAQDPTAARRWFEQASKQGHPKAKQALEQLQTQQPSP